MIVKRKRANCDLLFFNKNVSVDIKYTMRCDMKIICIKCPLLLRPLVKLIFRKQYKESNQGT